MKKHTASFEMTPGEKLWAACYYLIMFCALPTLLQWLSAVLLHLNDAQENFLYYFVSFLAVAWILSHYIESGWETVKRSPFLFLQSIILGLVAYYVCFGAITWAIKLLFPWFHNANDTALTAMAGTDRFLTAICVCLLVPVVEELLFRGLLFGSLYKKQPVLAYLVSTLAFGLIHILGYRMGIAAGLLSLLQYLPAGLWLAWSCTKSGSIFSAITIHALINGAALYFAR